MTAHRAAHWARLGLETIVALAILTAIVLAPGSPTWAPLWAATALPLAALVPRSLRQRVPGFAIVAIPFLYARLPFWLLDPASNPLVEPFDVLPLAWPAIVTTGAAYGLAWRGEALAEDETAAGTLLTTFQLGLLAMLLALAFLSGNPLFSTPQGVMLAIVYLVVGTVGLGAARWTGPAEAPDSGLGWVGMLLVVSGALAVVALLVTVVVSPEILLGVFDAIGLVLRPIGLLIAAVIERLIESIGQLQEEIRRIQEIGGHPIFGFDLPQWLLDAAGGLGLALVSLGWIAAIIRLFRALRQRLAVSDESPEETEAVEALAGEGVRGDLRRLWAWLLHFFHRPPPAIPASFAAASTPDPQQEILAGVRAVYRAFLTWADEQGVSRHGSETPDEFLRRVTSRFPEVQPESSLLTERYVTARYADDPVAPAVVDEVRVALERIRSACLPVGNLT